MKMAWWWTKQQPVVRGLMYCKKPHLQKVVLTAFLCHLLMMALVLQQYHQQDLQMPSGHLSSRVDTGDGRLSRALLALQANTSVPPPSPYLSSPLMVQHTRDQQVIPVPGLGEVQVLLNPSFHCEINEDSPRPPYLLVLVHSHAQNKPERDAVRDTWGKIVRDYNRYHQVRLVFVLGTNANSSTSDNQRLFKENSMYRDILMTDFEDTYRNLTIKSIVGLQWAMAACPHSEFYMKTDDDVYLNMEQLLSELYELDSDTGLIGALNTHSQVLREGVWGVEENTYPDTFYPPYCTGCAYAMRTSTARRLMSAAPRTPLMPIEDVYTTGLLAQALGFNCTNHKLFPNWEVGPTRTHVCSLLKQDLLGLHNVPYDTMYELHQNLQQGEVCYEVMDDYG